MYRFIAGLVIDLVLLPLMVAFYFRSGRAPVATAEPPMLFEKSLARAALHARMDREMPAAAPIEASDENMIEGARIYRDNCAFCHGLPGRPASASSQGMFPKPPQLFVKMVTDDPPGETYWKVANGIRLTGMPGYGKSLSTVQMWQVSLLLARADKTSPAAMEVLK